MDIKSFEELLCSFNLDEGELRIGDCDLCDLSLEQCTIFTEHFKQFNNCDSINLSEKNLGHMSLDCWEIFCMALAACHNLKSINLSYNQLHNMSAAHWHSLYEALGNSALKELIFCGNNLGSIEKEVKFAEFSELLVKCGHSLKKLNLSDNDLYLLSSNYWVQLGLVFKKIKLEKIYLNDNDFNAMDYLPFKKFCEALINGMPCLQELHLVDNDINEISEGHWVELGMVLAQARQLKCFEFFSYQENLTPEQFTKCWTAFSQCPNIKAIDLCPLIPQGLDAMQINLLLYTIRGWISDMLKVELSYSLAENIGRENCMALAEIFASRNANHKLFVKANGSIGPVSPENLQILTNLFLNSKIDRLFLFDDEFLHLTREQEEIIIRFLNDPICKVTKGNFHIWDDAASENGICRIYNALLAKPILTMLSARIRHHNRENLAATPIRKLPSDLIRLVGAQLAKPSI